MLFQISVICFLYVGSFTSAFSNNEDDRLILTPLIRSGKIEYAQNLSKVRFDEFGDVDSYSGYFTVNEQYNSNLFFWFFPSQSDWERAPIILWLEGGPATSSLIDVFAGNGPFELKPGRKLRLGEYTLIQNHSVIYIDNPVGTGFSYTDDNGYATNETIIGDQLYDALKQFFQLFPKLRNNDLYVGGISYAGKFVPAIGYTIYKNNFKQSAKINLKGMVIGNGWSDPRHQRGYADYLYQIGLIDENGRILLKEQEDKYLHHIENEQWKDAVKIYANILPGNDSLYKNLTGLDNFHNFLYPNTELSTYFKAVEELLQRKDVKKALHVGNIQYSLSNMVVFNTLREDNPKSVAPWIEELLNHYKMLFYVGQIDVICAYPLTLNFLRNLKFDGADGYKTAVRNKWYFNKQLVGYIKESQNLMEILVRNAGHAVQIEKPELTLDLMIKFTHNLTF